MRIANIFLSLAFGALAGGPQVRATDFPALGPGQILVAGDRLVCPVAREVVADLELDPGLPAEQAGTRLAVHGRKRLRMATPPIVDIALEGEFYLLQMSPQGTLLLYSRLEGRPDQEVWRNGFADGKWAVPGSRLELGADGALRILTQDGRTTWQSFQP